jgi:hypothetical protein
MTTVQRNTKGNRVLEVHGELNNDSKTHYEAELFIDGVTQGLEAITAGQIKHRYPVMVSFTIAGNCVTCDQYQDCPGC